MLKNFSAMLLAAGFGKRLMPLTKDLPKPLININGITLLDNSINFLRLLGCTQIIINSHYQYEKISRAIEKKNINNDLTLIYEKEILDTGGALKNVKNNFVNKNVIILNSDIFWQKENLFDIEKMADQYIANQNPQLLLVKNEMLLV